jgi:hypothetical protein
MLRLEDLVFFGVIVDPPFRENSVSVIGFFM